MTTNNLHTFVILAYQSSPYLEQCIQSVLQQTAPSTILLATTTPNSHIRKLARKYHLPLKTSQHTTIGGDFDFALSCASTPLVTIAHQDDFYAPQYSAQIIAAYQSAGSRTQILFTDYYELRNGRQVYRNQLLRIKRLLLTPLKFRFLSSQRWAKRFVLRFGNAICCPAVTFNLKQIHPPIFTSDLSCNVDWQAWERLSRQKGKFIYLKQPLMGHRIHSASETSKTIHDNRRSQEDYFIFQKFWPRWLAQRFTKAYKRSEQSNNMV